MNTNQRFVLGTVQLGMPYGIHNTHGQPTQEEAFRILDLALESGIDTFDTAFAYGTAEDVLGAWIETRGVADRVRIISKMKPHVLNEYPEEVSAVEVVRAEIEKSLKRLRVSSLDGYLFHSPYYIYIDRVVDGLLAARETGLVRNVGVSIYDIPEALQALTRGVQYVQVPYNAFDLRLEATDYFPDAAKKGITTFARSPFLQGALLMAPDELPPRLAYVRPHLATFIEIAKRHGISQTAAALAVALARGDTRVVFGVDTAAQLREDLELARNASTPEGVIQEMKGAFAELNHGAINPSLWSVYQPKA